MFDVQEKTLESVKESIKNIEEIDSAFLFGSCHNGKFGYYSDLDIMIVVEDYSNKDSKYRHDLIIKIIHLYLIKMRH